MSFPLKMRGASPSRARAKVTRRRRPALGLTSPLLDRRPDQLSGGERQRVAMGRALVRQAAGVPLRRAAVATSTRPCARASAASSPPCVKLPRRDRALRHPRPRRGDDPRRPRSPSCGRQGPPGRLPRTIYERPRRSSSAASWAPPAMNLLRAAGGATSALHAVTLRAARPTASPGPERCRVGSAPSTSGPGLGDRRRPRLTLVATVGHRAPRRRDHPPPRSAREKADGAREASPGFASTRPRGRHREASCSSPRPALSSTPRRGPRVSRREHARRGRWRRRSGPRRRAGCRAPPRRLPHRRRPVVQLRRKNREVLLAARRPLQRRAARVTVSPIVYQGDYFEALAKLRTALAAGRRPRADPRGRRGGPLSRRRRTCSSRSTKLPRRPIATSGSCRALDPERGATSAATERPALRAAVQPLDAHRVHQRADARRSQLALVTPDLGRAARPASALTRRDGDKRPLGLEVPIDWWFWVAMVGQAGGALRRRRRAAFRRSGARRAANALAFLARARAPAPR
jgi:hypothetical protein